jgi:hypothetical protein
MNVNRETVDISPNVTVEYLTTFILVMFFFISSRRQVITFIASLALLIRFFVIVYCPNVMNIFTDAVSNSYSDFFFGHFSATPEQHLD